MNHATVVWRFCEPEDAHGYEPWMATSGPEPDQRKRPIEWAVRVGDPTLCSSYTNPMTWGQATTVRDLVNHAYNSGRADARHAMRSALGL